MSQAYKSPGMTPNDADLATQDLPFRHTGPSPSPYSFLQPPEEVDEIGRLGPYRVLKLLGMGGMGMVFLAEDASLRRPVALKVMRPEFVKNKEKDESRFLREARAMAAIKHPRLATLYHADKVGDTLYLAMELLEGETVEAWIDRTADADIGEVLKVARDVAQGLSAIHDAGLVHRDLKPSNLWIESPSGRVKILDFGLAREIKDNTQITEAGFVIGTPAFLSPEQARGKQADHLSDLFSLGCVLYRMCTRQLPFPADNNLDQLAAITSDDPPPPQKFNAGLPQSLIDLVLELLAKDPKRRPQSAAAVADRLQQIRKQLTGKTRKKSSSARLDIRLPREPFVQKHALKIVIASFAAVIVGSIAFTAYIVLPRSEPRKEAGRKEPVAERPPERPMLPEIIVGDKFGVDRPALPEPPIEKLAPFDYLDMVPKSAAKGWPFQPPPDRTGMDIRVVVQGKQLLHGIFMHPAPKGPTYITFQLERKYRRLVGKAGLNDTGEDKAVTFSVFSGSNRLWWGTVQSRLHPLEFAINVKDISSVTLQVDVAGDPRGCHAVWMDPRLEK